MFEHADAIRNMLRRGTVVEVDDSGGQQRLRVRGLAGEELADILRVQSHGLTSTPMPGAVGIIAALGGRSDRAVLLGLESEAYRPRNLNPGGTAIYDAQGKVLKFVTGRADYDGAGGDWKQRNVQKVQLEAGVEYWIQPAPGASVFLGADPPFYPVVTTAGPSQHVFAAIGPPGPAAPQGVT